MQLLIVSGFLGSGKTTVIIETEKETGRSKIEATIRFSKLSLILKVLVHGQPKEILARRLLKIVNIPGIIWTGLVAAVSAAHEDFHIKKEVEV